MLLGIASHGIAQDITWPRQLTNEGSVLTMYQPQVQSWEQYEILDFRLAFSLKPAQGKEVVGVLYMKAGTDVNMETHRVFVSNISILKTNFPSLDPEHAEKTGSMVRSFFSPGRTLEISLEQIVACTPKEDVVATVTVNNDPPVIFVSKRPTILLQLEGAPVRAAASKESLEFVINANFPLFFDVPNKTYYLYDGLEWQKAQETDGPWSFAGELPTSLVNLAKDTSWSYLKGLVPAVSKPDKKMPQVFTSERLAELILFEGEPVFTAIGGTALKFATNTDHDIFLCTSDKQYYFLTAGRWFSSPGLNGPWTFATTRLPSDFLRIPDSSPASAILPFVPGTEQAKDAVMIAQIPTTIEVNAAEAAKQVHITYSGEPQFKAIESTTLYYAVNTTERVIKVSSNEYYACVQGIWFISSTPTGPWQTATYVPAAIYSMPPSSPVYNVTYVTQTVTYTNTVQATYTSGYMGVYVVGAPSGVIIVSGTGYYYPPYYYHPPYGYPVYYHYPVTYGVYAYHPYPYGGVAYHASYNPHTGMYSRSATAYSPYGKATVAQGYNPSTGTYARGASVSTPYGSRSAAQAYNPYTGASASTRQGSSPYAQWGSSTVSKGGQTASAAHVSTAQGSAAVAKTSSGNMYAASNGNVYKNTGNGWEEASKPPSQGNATGANKPTQYNAAATKQGNMQPSATTTKQGISQPSANPSSAKTSGGQSFNSQELTKEAQNRQRGSTEAHQYQGRTAPTGHQGAGSTGGSSGSRRR